MIFVSLHSFHAASFVNLEKRGFFSKFIWSLQASALLLNRWHRTQFEIVFGNFQQSTMHHFGRIGRIRCERRGEKLLASVGVEPTTFALLARRSNRLS